MVGSPFHVAATNQTLESFLRGHVEAFDALGGTARTLVYDNLRSAVLDRRGAPPSSSIPRFCGVVRKLLKTSRLAGQVPWVPR